MADFSVFSLGKAMQAGQQLAGNVATADNIAADRQKASKASELRQRVNEGDSEALGQLMALDPKDAKNVLDFLNTAEDQDRENMKAQNESVAKAIIWVMQAPTEQERAQRWDQSVDHMVNNQGNKDVAKYKGQYSQDKAQMMLMQAMTMDQLLDKQKGSFGSTKAGIDSKTGQPVYFATDKNGNKKILSGVRPTDKDISGSKSGKKWSFKATDSNTISRRAAEYYNVPFTEHADGSISYKFPTSNDAQKVARIKTRATSIYKKAAGSLTHDEALQQAIDETGQGKSLKSASEKGDTGNKSGTAGIKSYLNSLKQSRD